MCYVVNSPYIRKCTYSSSITTVILLSSFFLENIGSMKVQFANIGLPALTLGFVIDFTSVFYLYSSLQNHLYY